ncbi:Vacuolar protein sorting protein 25 [Zea mays]|uniref:ESCRT-II complex subunit VPS25 n=2 Tax=Zea mays TaxID=4577 RepID=A0A1D6NGW2_MAIZE|nr:Vacuolar protein sorting protein 25 [Zea mays]ONM39651.1 Vacuolar protein sorting protein 25 [Zea mays]
MRMLRWIYGDIRSGQVRNDDVCDRLGVAPFEEKLAQHRLRCFGHIQRKPQVTPMRSRILSLQPVRETREKQVQLWKDLILDYCRSQKIHTISLEEDFPLFSNAKIERSLSYEAKEVFLAALVSEGRAEWMDKGHKKCLILWLRIQDWANFILNFVKDNGLEVMTIEEIRSGIDTRGTELEGIDRGVLMRALRQLEQKGKAAIFKGTSADDEGVKFSV